MNRNVILMVVALITMITGEGVLFAGSQIKDLNENLATKYQHFYKSHPAHFHVGSGFHKVTRKDNEVSEVAARIDWSNCETGYDSQLVLSWKDPSKSQGARSFSDQFATKMAWILTSKKGGLLKKLNSDIAIFDKELGQIDLGSLPEPVAIGLQNTKNKLGKMRGNKRKAALLEAILKVELGLGDECEFNVDISRNGTISANMGLIAISESADQAQVNTAKTWMSFEFSDSQVAVVCLRDYRDDSPWAGRWTPLALVQEAESSDFRMWELLHQDVMDQQDDPLQLPMAMRMPYL